MQDRKDEGVHIFISHSSSIFVMAETKINLDFFLPEMFKFNILCIKEDNYKLQRRRIIVWPEESVSQLDSIFCFVLVFDGWPSIFHPSTTKANRRPQSKTVFIDLR